MIPSIMNLEWRPCPCGHSACKRQYPANLGTFYSGSGFDPEERLLLDEAFAALRIVRSCLDPNAGGQKP